MEELTGELRAAMPGCEVVLRFGDGHEISEPLRDALAELADAMYAEQLESSDDDVTGFSLGIGGLNLRGSVPTNQVAGGNCWGYDEAEGHCSWYSGPGVPSGGPSSCTIHSWK